MSQKKTLHCYRVAGNLLLGIVRKVAKAKLRVGLSDCFLGWKNEPWELVLGLVLFCAFFCDLEKVMNSEVSNSVGEVSSVK